MEKLPESNPVELATELTIAWLGNPNTRSSAAEVPDFLRSMYEAINGLSSPTATEQEPASEEFEPAVSVRKSLASGDHIISMIDGKPYKTLKRHLANHGLTPATYRQRYGLKPDYPMVAPSYAATRRELAKKIGLGRRSKSTESAPKPGEDTPAEVGASSKPRTTRRRASRKSTE